MSKQMIEVNVPEGMEIESVTSGVCTDGLRPSGPHFHVRLRPAWQWPKEWLFRWAAKDEDGAIYGYSAQPSLAVCTGYWSGDGLMARLEPGSTTFDIPGPWQDSLRENPNWKEVG